MNLSGIPAFIPTMLYVNREPWPLDGLKFETLEELRAERNPEDLEVDYGMHYLFEKVVPLWANCIWPQIFLYSYV